MFRRTSFKQLILLILFFFFLFGDFYRVKKKISDFLKYLSVFKKNNKKKGA